MPYPENRPTDCPHPWLRARHEPPERVLTRGAFGLIMFVLGIAVGMGVLIGLDYLMKGGG